MDMPDISIIIVNYNVKDFLVQALHSLRNAAEGLNVEYIVVDNHSTDGSVPFLRSNFPEITIIENKKNTGFGHANNQAMKICRGRYILLINPDSIVQHDTLHKMLEFFEHYRDCGMAGCKVLNPDASLQLACRRGFPTPLAALGKFTGLSHFFPKSKVWGRYNLTYLDPDETNEVEAISGSFMMLRRNVLDEVGSFDEDFFLYGEDLDLCYRVRQAGWKIYYYPGTSIVHHKGESARRSHVDIAGEFYRAMHIFVEKHFQSSYSYYPLWLLKAGIWIQAIGSAILGKFRGLFLPLLDWSLVAGAILCAVAIRFGGLIPLPVYYDFRSYMVIVGISGLTWLFILATHGIYHRHYFSYLRIASGVISGFFVIGALTFFFNAYAFSRLVVLYAGILSLFFLWSWRLLFRQLMVARKAAFLRPLFARRTAIWGANEGAREIAAQLRITRLEEYEIIGFLCEDEADLANVPPEIRILGGTWELQNILTDNRIAEVVFTPDVPHEGIFRAIMECDEMGVRFTLMPGRWEVLVGNASGLPGKELPLVDMNSRLNYKYNKILKRGLDLLFSGCILLFIGWIAVIRGRQKGLKIRELNLSGSRGREAPIQFLYLNDSFYTGWEQFVLECLEVFRGKISFVGAPLSLSKNRTESSVQSMLKPGIWSPVHGLVYTANHQLEQELFYVKNYSIFHDISIIRQGVMTPSQSYYALKEE